MAWYTAVALCAGAALIAAAMIPAWLDPEVSALMAQTMRAECRGGPHDGHRQAVLGDVEIIWVGPVRAIWAIESEAAPENLVGDTLCAYRRTDETTADGTTVYEWVEPSA